MPSPRDDACSRNATRRSAVEQPKASTRLADNNDADFMDCTYLSRQRAFDDGDSIFADTDAEKYYVVLSGTISVRSNL